MSYECVAEVSLGGRSAVAVKATCVECRKVTNLVIPEEEWLSWTGGELAQRALRSLDKAQRELLISGICGVCFEKIFAETDE